MMVPIFWSKLVEIISLSKSGRSLAKIMLVSQVFFICAGCISAGKLHDVYSSVKSTFLPIQELRSVTITTTGDMNESSPVALDLLLVFSDDAKKILEDLTANQWFTQKQDILNQFRKEIQISSWEMIPSQRLSNLELQKSNDNYICAIIFANYNNSFTNRRSISDVKEMTIVMKRNSFILNY